MHDDASSTGSVTARVAWTGSREYRNPEARPEARFVALGTGQERLTLHSSNHKWSSDFTPYRFSERSVAYFHPRYKIWFWWHWSWWQWLWWRWYRSRRWDRWWCRRHVLMWGCGNWLAMACLPSVTDRIRALEKLKRVTKKGRYYELWCSKERRPYRFFLYSICNTLNDFADDAEMVSIGFIITESHHAPTWMVNFPMNFDNSIIDLLATLFETKTMVNNAHIRRGIERETNRSHSSSSTYISSNCS